MRDISELPNVFNEYFDKLEKRLETTMNESCKELENEVKAEAKLPYEVFQYPTNYYKYDNLGQFSSYLNSIKSHSQNMGDRTINGHVYSDMLVSFKGRLVPFGAFIEWGVGSMGMVKNTYQHGYEYTLVPWDKATKEQQKSGLFGMTPQPHWTPSFNHLKWKIIEKVKKCI